MNTEPNKTIGFFESVILFSRYLLLPLYIGLTICVLFYGFAFYKELTHLGANFFAAEDQTEFLMLSILNLLDMTMIGSLIVMVTIGSYSVFVKEIDFARLKNAPRFLKNMTSGMLKVKMGASLVAVSSVHLLNIFMKTEHVSWEDFSKKVVIHMTFIISAYLFTKMESMLHPAHSETTKESTHQ